jgi:glycosyltransferase involved in cell wall biosynthesis
LAKVLFIVPIAHCSLHTGSGQRTSHLYRALAGQHRVDVLLMPEYHSAALVHLYPAWFQQRFPGAGKIFLAPAATAPASGWRRLPTRVRDALASPALRYERDPAAARALMQHVRDEGYDLLAGRYLAPVARSGALAIDGARVLLDVDDRDDKVIESRIASLTTPAVLKPLLRRHLPGVRDACRQLYARCAHVWLASDADLAEVAHPSVSVLRNVPYEPAESASRPPVADVPPDSRICLFVGSTHRMNREGVLHFVRHGWPLVRASVPDARLRIVGTGGWERFKARLEASAGVEVVGAVDDLAGEYAAARFSVIPVFEGAGTKIKVLESLRYGRTVAAHRHSIHGFDDLVPAQSLLAADSHAGIAEACIALFSDPALAQRLASAGARVVDGSYSYASFARTVDRDVARVLSRARVTCEVAE